ncbi:MAG: hypothetical protein JRN62_02830 [Nitrososphaerota archaeon]|nr:hypothetical protein [Nitrososphaerota archaeon]MDG6948929.1 hypothetical protein [Nitrososphaerota archaeon]
MSRVTARTRNTERGRLMEKIRGISYGKCRLSDLTAGMDDKQRAHVVALLNSAARRDEVVINDSSDGDPLILSTGGAQSE